MRYPFGGKKFLITYRDQYETNKVIIAKSIEQALYLFARRVHFESIIGYDPIMQVEIVAPPSSLGLAYSKAKTRRNIDILTDVIANRMGEYSQFFEKLPARVSMCTEYISSDPEYYNTKEDLRSHVGCANCHGRFVVDIDESYLSKFDLSEWIAEQPEKGKASLGRRPASTAGLRVMMTSRDDLGVEHHKLSLPFAEAQDLLRAEVLFFFRLVRTIKRQELPDLIEHYESERNSVRWIKRNQCRQQGEIEDYLKAETMRRLLDA